MKPADSQEACRESFRETMALLTSRCGRPAVTPCSYLAFTLIKSHSYRTNYISGQGLRAYQILCRNSAHNYVNNESVRRCYFVTVVVKVLILCTELFENDNKLPNNKGSFGPKRDIYIRLKNICPRTNRQQ